MHTSFMTYDYEWIAANRDRLARLQRRKDRRAKLSGLLNSPYLCVFVAIAAGFLAGYSLRGQQALTEVDDARQATKDVSAILLRDSEPKNSHPVERAPGISHTLSAHDLKMLEGIVEQ